MATRQAPSATASRQETASEGRAAEMDLQDREVLNVIQTAFPMDERPYLAIGRELGLEESDVIQRIRRLRRENVVRQIGGIFDTRRLGYKTSLIAFRYPEDLLHKGALAVNKHPGVSHNYARVGHEYNLWFTLAVPPYESLEETAERMAEETHVESWRLLPVLRFAAGWPERVGRWFTDPARFGVPLEILFAALVVWVVWRAARRLRRRSGDRIYA